MFEYIHTQCVVIMLELKNFINRKCLYILEPSDLNLWRFVSCVSVVLAMWHAVILISGEFKNIKFKNIEFGV
jgi:hypothetical protein